MKKANHTVLRQSYDQKGKIVLTIDGKRKIYMNRIRHYILKFDIKND